MRLWRSILFVAAFVASGVAQAKQPTLTDYVSTRDPVFSHGEVVKETRGDGYTTYVVDFTSQAWRSAAEVDRHVWRHYLKVVVPSTIRSRKALMLINGGRNSDSQPGDAHPLMTMFAKEVGAVTIDLATVPNQPLSFPDKPGDRVEDDIIGYSWDKYLRTGESPWIAQFAMTKAAVRALDVAEALVQQKLGWTPEGWIVTGASKRGWTTWLTAVADRRVLGIAPIVIDVLNVIPSMMHHREVYGFWAEAIQDYVNHGITDRMGTPEMTALVGYIDPWIFRAQLTLPKMILNAANDEFFLPDSSQFYYKDLQGPKYLRYVPNSGHNINEPDIVLNIAALFESIDTGRPLPGIDWEVHGDTAMTLVVPAEVKELTLYEAVSPDVRDFRNSDHMPVYQPTTLALRSDGRYEISVTRPAKGWKAWMVETRVELASGTSYKLTTQITVAGVAPK